MTQRAPALARWPPPSDPPAAGGNRVRQMRRGLERFLIVLVSLAISISVIALLSGGLLAGRDDPGVSAGQNGPGTRFPDQGDLHLRAGELRPVYNSDPPTSGAHIPQAVGRDRSELSDDQLLQALEVGDVVLMYGAPQPPAGLAQIAQAVGGRFTPALALSGQAVILARRPGTRGVIALAWTRMLRSLSAPDLRGFAQFWLGRGATGPGSQP
jgi:hypothetical protein